jgi:hypothetical protein
LRTRPKSNPQGVIERLLAVHAPNRSAHSIFPTKRRKLNAEWGGTKRNAPTGIDTRISGAVCIDDARWSELDMEVHEHPIVSGPIGEIKEAIDHHDYRGLYQFTGARDARERHPEVMPAMNFPYGQLTGFFGVQKIGLVSQKLAVSYPLCFGGFRRRTPGPPPFSSMHSTPAAADDLRR